MAEKQKQPKSAVRSTVIVLVALALIAGLAFAGVANGFFADWLIGVAVAIGVGCVIGLATFLVVFLYQLVAVRSFAKAFMNACEQAKGAFHGTIDELVL